MKLLKLLYFVFRDYLQKYREMLFVDRFEVWPYGPVLVNVYYEFKRYGARAVSGFYEDTSGNVFIITETPELTNVIDDVWYRYHDKSGIDLSNITHQEGSAWRKAWEANKEYLDYEDIINDLTA